MNTQKKKQETFKFYNKQKKRENLCLLFPNVNDNILFHFLKRNYNIL